MEGMVLGTDGKQVIPRHSTRLNPSLTTSVSHSHDVNVKVIEPSVVVDDESPDHLGDTDENAIRKSNTPTVVETNSGTIPTTKQAVQTVGDEAMINIVEEYGIQKVTMNANGFLFFKFSTVQVVEDAL
ncbi:hypothetical protein Tco_0363854 [Tanacetum coccineum]